MEDGDFIVKCQDNEIVVSDDKCYLNGEVYPVETIISMI
jgi:hypothetical protein